MVPYGRKTSLYFLGHTYEGPMTNLNTYGFTL